MLSSAAISASVYPLAFINATLAWLEATVLVAKSRVFTKVVINPAFEVSFPVPPVKSVVVPPVKSVVAPPVKSVVAPPVVPVVFGVPLATRASNASPIKDS